MAFAGNDLVNFIGMPLAGFESFIKRYPLAGHVNHLNVFATYRNLFFFFFGKYVNTFFGHHPIVKLI
jgi:hypothetical protein